MFRTVYLVPEYQSGNPFFFAHAGKLTSQNTIPINGFRLYALSDNLNDFRSHFTVVAIQSPGFVSSFYSIEFTKTLKFEQFGFSTIKIGQHRVLYMKMENFIKYDRYISIPNGDWTNSGALFHSVGAFRDIGLLPCISESFFSKKNSIESLEKELAVYYGIHGPYLTTLSRVFSDVFFSLDFFGFTNTKDQSESISIKYAEEISKQSLLGDCGCNFCFGNIKPSLMRFHGLCFPERSTHPTILTHDTYKSLIDLIQYVAQMLRLLGYTIIDEDLKSSLTKCLSMFQKSHNIREEYCGPLTIKSLIFEVSGIENQQTSLAAGVMPKTSDKFSLNIPRFNGIPQISALIDTIPLTIERQLEISNTISQVLDKSAESSDILFEQISGCEKRLNLIASTLKEVDYLSNTIESHIVDATKSLNEVLNNHHLVQQRIVVLREKIASEKRGNVLFTLFVVIVIVVIFSKITSIIHSK